MNTRSLPKAPSTIYWYIHFGIAGLSTSFFRCRLDLADMPSDSAVLEIQ